MSTAAEPIFESFILYLKKKYEKKYPGFFNSQNAVQDLKEKNRSRIAEFDEDKSLVLFILLNSIVRSQLWKKQTFTNYIIGTTKGWATPIAESTTRTTAQDVIPPFAGTFSIEDILKHDCFLRMVYIDCMLDDVDLWYVPDDNVSCSVPSSKKNGGGMKNINQRGGGGCKNVFRIFQIATCAFLWGIISNNYYEKLETFGPQISLLIKQNYQDVLTPHIGEMTNLKNVLEDIQGRVVEGGVDKGELNVGEIKDMNLKHLETLPSPTIEDGVPLSYGTIAEYLGISYYKAIFGEQIDIIDIIEEKVTNAVTRDVIEIVKRRIITMKAESSEKGNKNPTLTKLGDVVTNFISGFFHSSSPNYMNAPGMMHSADTTMRRTQQIRFTWATWQDSFAQSTGNFVKDVLLHIKTTSYYLWAYFIGMQALEVAAVRAFYKLVVRWRSDGAGDADGDADAVGETKQMGSTLELIDKRVEDMEEVICTQTGVPSATVRSIKYLLIVALFRGLAETMRMSVGKSSPMDLKTNIIFLQNTDLIPDQPPAKSCSKGTNSVQYLAVCRNLNEGSQEQPSLKPSSSSSKPLALTRGLSTSLAIPNMDYHRTSNGITINIPKGEGEAARFEAILGESKKERDKNKKPVELTGANVVLKKGGGRKRKTRKRRKKSKRKTRKKKNAKKKRKSRKHNKRQKKLKNLKRKKSKTRKKKRNSNV